ncbi:MAG: diguanylate cyclase [Thermodesulfobacteriota bacterium]
MATKIKHKIQTSLRNVLKVSFPPSMGGLLREASKPYPDFANIASLIGTDPGLTATVLSLVNSPAYYLKEKVFDLKRAVVVLGSNEILKLAISATFMRNMRFKSKNRLDFVNWRKIVWAAGAAELIAKQVCPREAEQIYLGALLKDLSVLLICLFDADGLEKARQIICSEEDNDFIRLSPGQLEKERENWGVDHTVLTRDLLEYWNFPEQSYKYVAGHHNLDDLEQCSPGEQAVIIGTYWAELELSAKKDVNGILQLRALMNKIPGLEDIDFNNLRTENAKNFRAICSNLEICEEDRAERLYDCPLEKIQDLYFMTQGIEQIKGDLERVLAQAARHLYLLWCVQTFRAVLKSPLTGHYHHFTFDPESGLQAVDEISDPEKIESKISNSEESFVLRTATGNYGFLAIGSKLLPRDRNREMALYFRLLSRSFEIYYLHQREISGKAHMMDIIPVGVARLDSTGQIVQANPMFWRFTGRDAGPEDLFFADVLPIHAELKQDREWNLFLAGDRERYSRLFCPLTPDQEGRSCWHIAAHRISMEGLYQIMALLEDISSITTLEADVLNQREFMRAMLESMQDIVMTVDDQGTILYSSPRIGPDIIGKNLFTMATPAGLSTIKWGPDLLEEQSSPLEVTFDTGQDLKSLELIITRLGGEKPNYMVVGRDLTTIRRLEQKVKRQAVLDGLTNIYNRRQLEIFLKREVNRAQRTASGLGVVFFDLDKFKEFNDHFGHQQGDKAIVMLANIMRSQSRSGTDFPCRYGGDEFIILASDTNEEGLKQLAERVRDKFREEFQSRITLSIGLAMLDKEESREEFVNRADIAAYTAKKNGGNNLVWG